MKTIHARNVNQAVAMALPYLLAEGIEETSRNGSVLVAPGPVMTIYENPQERVLFSPLRDANPFFHLMESLWMLSGRNDLAFPMQFNKRFAEYSDDGKTVWGAYGWRWREFFGYDQLEKIIAELKRNPTSRRCVLSMWNGGGHGDDAITPVSDLDVAFMGGKDVPCNTHAYFDCRGGVLNMTVCNRSNDAIWGAYGANVVHFSILQEYLANKIGVPMGKYHQMSNNFHAYTDIYNKDKLLCIAEEGIAYDWYSGDIAPKITSLGADDPDWDKNLEEFMENGFAAPVGRYPNFFTLIAAPMYWAWKARTEGDIELARSNLENMPIGSDWRLAAEMWIDRREEKKNAA